jgi:uncharacterized protein
MIRKLYTAISALGFGTLIGAAALTASSEPMRQEAQNRAIVAERFDAWRAGTGGPFELLAENAKWTIAGNSMAAGTYPSREAFMSEVIQPFNARIVGSLYPTVRALYADGDTVIAHFDATAPTINGGVYENTYTWIMDLEDGRIINVTAFFDSIAFDALWTSVPAQVEH